LLAAKAAKEDKPKRAPSPYIVFCTEKRPEIKAKNPEAGFGELGKLLGQLWATMDDKAKAQYVKTSEAKKAALAK
jgi:HMG (high mobility group) box